MRTILTLTIAIGLISLTACKKEICEPKKPQISQDSIQKIFRQKKIS